MALSSSFDPATGIITVRVTGTMTVAEVERFIADLPAVPSLGARADTIWDLDAYDFSSATKSLFEHFIERRQSIPERALARLALVASSDLGFGMCRMYQLMSEAHGNVPEGQINVFRDTKEATAWLAKPET
ncbi:MAG: hypothetical protein QNJ16_13470 [Rhodobacter sp.]|nr:hypothetical protein [Rhodobacter sp.]